MPAFYERGWLEPGTLEALDEEGVAYEDREDADDEDVEFETTESPIQSRFRIREIVARFRIWLANTSKRIEEVYAGHRGWFLLASGFMALVTFLILIAVSFFTGDEDLPPIVASPTPSPTLPSVDTQSDTATPTQTSTPSPEPSATYTSAVESTATDDVAASLDEDSPTISISEIMFVPQAPQGNADLESWNEYIELYNYGNDPVDVSGWWISDSGTAGNADQLVAWTDRLSDIPVGEATIDSTVILAGGYALILSPKYDEGNKPYNELVTDGTIILTLADDPDSTSELIGKDGLMGRGELLDVLVLFIGTIDQIGTAVSTYGTPTWDNEGNVDSIRDNGLDSIPRGATGDWGGFRRDHLHAADAFSNWIRFTWEDMTPGFAYSEPDGG